MESINTIPQIGLTSTFRTQYGIARKKVMDYLFSILVKDNIQPNSLVVTETELNDMFQSVPSFALPLGYDIWVLPIANVPQLKERFKSSIKTYIFKNKFGVIEPLTRTKFAVYCKEWKTEICTKAYNQREEKRKGKYWAQYVNAMNGDAKDVVAVGKDVIVSRKKPHLKKNTGLKVHQITSHLNITRFIGM